MTRPFIIGLQLTLVLAASVGFFVRPPKTTTGISASDHRLSAVLSEIRADSLMQTVEVLASEDTRRLASSGADAAVTFITAKLGSWGYSVEQQLIRVNAPDGRTTVVTNVLCDLGSAGDPPLLLCAHYDSRGASGEVKAPGADDNASGVAVLLETARVLAVSNVAANVRLAFFGGEEDEFIGSQGFVEDAGGDLPSAAINVDMVGYDRYGPKDIVVFSNTVSLPIYETLLRAAQDHTRLKLSARVASTGNSDHATFWSHGVPAVSLWEGYDHNPHYHTENDTPEHLSPDYLTEVARLVAAVAFRLGVLGGDALGLAPEQRLTLFRDDKNGLSQRFIGERDVESLPDAADGGPAAASTVD